MYKYPKIFEWFQEFNKSAKTDGVRFVLEIKIKSLTFDPKRFLDEMSNYILFDGFSNNYAAIKIHRWTSEHKPEDLDIDGFNWQFSDRPDELIMILAHPEPVEYDDALEDALEYEFYADMLFSKWLDDRWNDKFMQYKDDFKIIFIKVLMRSPNGITYFTKEFELEDFGQVFMQKYGETDIVKSLDAIFIEDS